jgi:hypothetical protein
MSDKKHNINPNSLANLSHAKKGEIRNPNGNNGMDRRRKLNELVNSRVTPENWDKIVAKATEQAEEGDKAARQWLSENGYGKPDTVGSEDKGVSARGTLIQNNFGELTRQQLEDIVNQSAQDVNYTETDL